MAFQVLARKWRPSNFSQLVGQDHVSRSLIHALQHQRLHHAYLFTGTRGVGKTTVARILAKAINCENLQDSNPCGQCTVCSAFDQGRFLDLIEVDAASRTKVEDTRDLLDNAQYAPNQGRYKVYLIDEVHMLSGHSFNALLKTLEEPPSHVKFLLATTDPQKIPVTVLSRCLQFNLKRLTSQQIAKQMQFILDQEQIVFELSAISLLARAADGSMRDGLSLLDQAIVFGSGRVTRVDVEGMLGTVAQQPVDDILRALAQKDISLLLAKIALLAELSPDYAGLLHQLLKVLHRVALQQHSTACVDDEFDRQLIAALAEQLSVEDVQLYYQIGLIGQRDLLLAPDPRIGFEMVMLRMLAFRLQTVKSVTQDEVVAKKPAVKSDGLAKDRMQEFLAPKIGLSGSDEWAQMIEAMRLSGLTRELANNCVLDSVDEHGCRLLLDPGFQQVGGKAEANLQAALQGYLGRPLKVQIISQFAEKMTPAVQKQKQRDDRQQEAIDAIGRDENVLFLKEKFGARVLSGSIEPLD